jgi:hypothetical protein
MNVQSLMDNGYTIAGITQPPSGGAGVFLQKGNALFFLFCRRDAGFADGRHQILQAGEIAER